MRLDTSTGLRMDSSPILSSPILADPIGDDLRSLVTSYWKMGEASGNRANSKGSTVLVQTGTVGSGSGGPLGDFASFPGTAGNYLSAADDAEISLGASAGGFTIGLWLNPDDTNARYMISKNWGGCTTNASEYLISVQDGNAKPVDEYSSYPDTTERKTNAVNGILTAGTWHLHFMWYDPADGKLYQQTDDGTIYSSGPHASAPADSPGVLNVGIVHTSCPASILYKGGMQHLMFFAGTVLTAEQRTYLWNSGAGRALYP